MLWKWLCIQNGEEDHVTDVTDEESQIIRWYTPNKELSHCVKKWIIDGADKVESFWNTDNVSRNVLSLLKESIRL